jgi:hypothetical protein
LGNVLVAGYGRRVVGEEDFGQFPECSSRVYFGADRKWSLD